MNDIEKRLSELEKNPLFDYLSQKNVLTAEEASKVLGCSMSYLYKLTSRKLIPHYCPSGKMLYFDNAELREWMKTHDIGKMNDEDINDLNESDMTPKIEKTMDYDMFDYMDENRAIREGKVKNLIKAIEELDLTPYQPIVVSWNKKVVDGQHRLEACKRLGLPIYYIMLDKNIDVRAAMIVLNQVVTQWKMTDFLNFHAEMQGGRWEEMREWDEKHKLGLSNTAVLFAEKQMNATQIREGVVNFKKNDKADEIAEFLKSDEVKRLKYGHTRPFVIAIRHAFERYNARQLKKLKASLVFVDHKANFEQYITAFDNLVGKKK